MSGDSYVVLASIVKYRDASILNEKFIFHGHTILIYLYLNLFGGIKGLCAGFAFPNLFKEFK